MPSLAKILGLILPLAASIGLIGPTPSAGQSHYPPTAAATDRLPQTESYRRDNSLPPSGIPDWVRQGQTPSPIRQVSYSETPGRQPPPRILPAAHQSAPLPLSPPGHAGTGSSSAERPGGLPSMVTVIGSLAVVLGIFFLIAWGMRRATPGGAATLPGDVFEVLGRAPMGGRQQVHLLRCGAKLVLVSTTPAGAEPLTEITDPVEVDRLAGFCRQARPDSTTAMFRQVFQQVAGQGTGQRHG